MRPAPLRIACAIASRQNKPCYGDELHLARPMHAPPTVSFHPTLCGQTLCLWPQTIAVARAAGFDAMDLVPEEIANEPAEAVRDRLARANLRAGPATLPVEFRQDEDRFRRDYAGLPAFARLAAAVGVKTMFRSVPASSEVPAAELTRVLRRRLSACATVLQAHDIALAIEPIGPLHRRRAESHEFIWRLADAAELALSCDGAIGLLVDSWHWHHAGESAKQIVAVGPLIRHVHLADAPDIPALDVRDWQRLLPGQGVIDFVAFGLALEQARYDGFASPEVRGYACANHPRYCAAAALRATRRALGAAAAPQPSESSDG